LNAPAVRRRTTRVNSFRHAVTPNEAQTTGAQEELADFTLLATPRAVVRASAVRRIVLQVEVRNAGAGMSVAATTHRTRRRFSNGVVEEVEDARPPNRIDDLEIGRGM